MNDGWIEWKGGKCPVDRSDTVEVKFKYNPVDSKTLGASYIRWTIYNDPTDVIAYRVVSENIDPVIKKVREKILKRSQAGLNKYGVGLDRADLNFDDWLTNLQEELMDAVNYIEAIKYKSLQVGDTLTAK